MGERASINLKQLGGNRRKRAHEQRESSKMKSSVFKPLGILLLVVALLVCIVNSAPTNDSSCRLRAKEAKDCSLCCAIGGYNKFDSQRFQSGKGCHCFKDEKEVATNERHKQRRP